MNNIPQELTKPRDRIKQIECSLFYDSDIYNLFVEEECREFLLFSKIPYWEKVANHLALEMADLISNIYINRRKGEVFSRIKRVQEIQEHYLGEKIISDEYGLQESQPEYSIQLYFRSVNNDDIDRWWEILKVELEKYENLLKNFDTREPILKVTSLSASGARMIANMEVGDGQFIETTSQGDFEEFILGKVNDGKIDSTKILIGTNMRYAAYIIEQLIILGIIPNLRKLIEKYGIFYNGNTKLLWRSHQGYLSKFKQSKDYFLVKGEIDDFLATVKSNMKI
jgi:hypothetical protein